MSQSIIESSLMTPDWRQWLSSPAGLYLLEWEQAQLDHLVADVFGYHALQLGMPRLAGLQANRMPHQWLACADTIADEGGRRIDLGTHPEALPFKADSLDLLVMPHGLELSLDAHASLREAHRVLVPEGHLVMTGLNPTSLWGWRFKRAQWYRRWGFGDASSAPSLDLIGYWRLRDWLRLLGFEVKFSQFGCWRPALDTPHWFQRWLWLERMGSKWWPILGGAYVIVAVKKVHGGRILGASWKSRRPSAKPAVSIAQRQTPGPVDSTLQRKSECEPR